MASGRVFSYLAPALLKCYLFYLYTFSVMNQPSTQVSPVFVATDSSRISVSTFSGFHEQSVHQPLLAELDSDEKTRELQARLGISVFHQVVSAQQILDLACMFLILFCILTRPSFFSFCLLVFLFFYTLHAGYPWQAAARYLILPVCLIIFVQYIGSFASVLALPARIRTLLDALGVSSAEPFEPKSETLVLFSADSREQFAYNVRLMIGFMTIGLVCIVMSALDTERFAAVYSLLAFCWRRLQCVFEKWRSLNEKETLQRIRIERRELMQHVVSTMTAAASSETPASGASPASPGSIRDSLTSEVDWSEMEREIDEVVEKARCGQSGAEIDAIARGYIEAAGYGKYFTHRTGHGIGMQIHEEACLSQDNTAVPIMENYCFSVEPGIYIAGKIGVRYEDCFYMTKNGIKQIK